MKDHAKFFKDHDINGDEILDHIDWVMSNHEEVFVKNVISSILNKTLNVYATKSDNYAFVRVGNEDD